MSSSTSAYSGEPLRRTPADQEKDHQEFCQNLETDAYLDWPNEAGFLGLEEQTEPIELELVGDIPQWVQGTLYRTGPGQYQIETDSGKLFETDHWFDGLAQTHRFDITVDENQTVKVFYSSRRQAHEIAEQIKKDGRRAGYSFGQKLDPCLSLYGKFMSAYRALWPDAKTRQTENINVAVQLDLPGLDHVKGNMLDGTQKAAVSPTPSATKDHRAKLPSAVWLLTDTSGMKQIDPDTLEPIGFARQLVLHPDLKGQVSCAHGERDPDTGDYINFNKEMGKETAYRCFQVSAATGKTEILATICRPDIKPAYIHSFFLSPHFAVLSVPSSHLGLGGVSVAWNRNVVESIVPFNKNLKTKWFIIDRHSNKGVVAEFETDAGFFFHAVNAFEERDEQDLHDGTVSLFCDVVQYASTDIIYSMYLDVIMNRNDGMKTFWKDNEDGKPGKRVETANTALVRHRVRVPLPESESEDTPAVPVLNATTTVPNITDTVEQLFAIHGPHSGELPTYNPLYKTKKIRYVYAMTQRGLSSLLDSIVKTDVVTKEALIWNNPKGHTPGEAIFVPRPGGTEEDDGVLLSVILNGNTGTSYLLCLDAKTMKEMGRAEVGKAIGFGFHGVHYQV